MRKRSPSGHSPQPFETGNKAASTTHPFDLYNGRGRDVDVARSNRIQSGHVSGASAPTSSPTEEKEATNVLSDPVNGLATSQVLLDVKDLRVDFAGEHGRLEVVSGASFRVNAGETLGLVGESGSGKTVTGLSIMGLIPDPPGRVTNGEINFDGRDLRKLSGKELRKVRGAEISMIFQDPMTSLSPSFTIGDQIGEALRLHTGVGRRAARARAIEMLDLVGIPKAAQRVDRYPHEFSGGMRQRAMIAIALSCRPKLLIADEPTTALDVTIQSQILDLIQSLRDELGMAVLFVTHDLGVVAETCDRVVVMYAGQIVEMAPAIDLFGAPRHPYSEGLLNSLPRFDETQQVLESIPGTVPTPDRMPTGCRFRDRCRYAIDRCSDEVPLSREGQREVRCVRANELELVGTE